MSLPVVLRAEAEAEFDEAFDFYDGRGTGLSRMFAAAIQAVFDGITAQPRMHAVALADVRKAVVRRYPYCVYFRPHPDRIEVLSVFHTSRDPSIWQGRV
ncbi:type II toxin-antitoxin system RelE/ParE family toxin [Urbifossiella limnaea]|uniref:Plasmid stabilization system protein n=1 Tax=Urbifossiella limnaea TaxID=2528023 RepID=A0A517XNN0_9BACT|nr:type II toxin-antitoxin system RelE/ParE family toxin [Urbifossiella limnaea]QDU19113.1 Plasmid stabilization system protein [Urbifossiella limnaea]